MSPKATTLPEVLSTTVEVTRSDLRIVGAERRHGDGAVAIGRGAVAELAVIVLSKGHDAARGLEHDRVVVTRSDLRIVGAERRPATGLCRSVVMPSPSWP